MKAIAELNPEKEGAIKNWMLVSAFVTSCVIGVYICASLPLFLSAFKALCLLDLKSAILCFTISTGALGFGIPVAEALYERGLELLKTDEWVALKSYMQLSHAEKEHDFLKKIAFFTLLHAPQILDLLPSSMRVKLLGDFFPFLPEKIKLECFDHQLKSYESYDSLNAFNFQEKEGFEKELVSYYQGMSKENQDAHLSKFLRVCTHNILSKLTKEDRDAITKKANQLETEYDNRIASAQEKLNEMQSKIDSISIPKSGQTLSEAEIKILNEIKENLLQLQLKLTEYLSLLKTFSPSFNQKSCSKLTTELLNGDLQNKIQRLVSIQAAINEEEIDLEDSTWNYILMNYTGENRIGGQILLGEVAKKFNVGPQDLDALDAELQKSNIETIGKFLDHVLKGKKDDLKNVERVLAQLDTFLSNQKETRNLLYTTLAGPLIFNKNEALSLFQQGNSKLVSTASKVAYYSAMILTTIAPAIIYPTHFQVGVVATILYHAAIKNSKIQKISQSVIDSLKSDSPSLPFLFNIATRRPFISLFMSNNLIATKVNTYQSASFLGKMRILSTEHFYGLLLLYAAWGNLQANIPLGGFISGAALGMEAVNLGGLAWKKFLLKPMPK